MDIAVNQDREEKEELYQRWKAIGYRDWDFGWHTNVDVIRKRVEYRENRGKEYGVYGPDYNI